MRKGGGDVPAGVVDGSAFFVFSPRNAEELSRPFPLERLRPFRIVARVTLSGLDYENFAADMLVERAYLEAYEDACRIGDVYACVLVRRRGKGRGILVVPDSGGYTRCAAIYDPPEEP